MSLNTSRRSFLAFLLVGFIVRAQAYGDVAALTRLLEEHQIAYDRNEADAVMFDSLLKLVDPYAVNLGTNHAYAVDRLQSVMTIEEWPDAIMYVKLSGFYDMGTTSITARLREWMTNEVFGVIIDLRGAGGDNLSAADALVGDIVEDDIALYEIRDGLDRVLETRHLTQGTKLPGMPPLMLLVDDETHGASEIFVAVSAASEGLMLIGSETRGDPRLREYVTLNESNTLYIATRWIVPSRGERYDGVGVRPHILVEQEQRADASVDRSTQAGTGEFKTPPKGDVESDSLRGQGSDPAKPGTSERIQTGRQANDAEDPELQQLDPVQARARDILRGLNALRKNDARVKTTDEDESS